MTDPRRGGYVAPWASTNGFVVDREFDLPFEDEEGIDLVGMDVRRDGAELRVAGEFDHLELGAFSLHDEVAVLSRNRLAFAGA